MSEIESTPEILIIRLCLIADSLRFFLTDIVKEFDLTWQDYFLLLAIPFWPNCNQEAFAKMFKVSAPTISRSVRKLTVKGFVRQLTGTEWGAYLHYQKRLQLTGRGIRCQQAITTKIRAGMTEKSFFKNKQEKSLFYEILIIFLYRYLEY